MKTLVKFVNLHDGNSIDVHNGNRICIETYPRMEAIIAAYYDDGWELINRTPQLLLPSRQMGIIHFTEADGTACSLRRLKTMQKITGMKYSSV